MASSRDDVAAAQVVAAALKHAASVVNPEFFRKQAQRSVRTSLDTLFLATPVSFKGRIVQQVGRITRTGYADGPAVEVHDYHDRLVPLFDRMQKKRRRLMVGQGFTEKS